MLRRLRRFTALMLFCRASARYRRIYAMLLCLRYAIALFYVMLLILFSSRYCCRRHVDMMPLLPPRQAAVTRYFAFALFLPLRYAADTPCRLFTLLMFSLFAAASLMIFTLRYDVALPSATPPYTTTASLAAARCYAAIDTP